MNHNISKSDHLTYSKFVDAEGLLVALFEEGSRPSVRWVRKMQYQRVIPHKKIGGLVVFEVPKVREALDNNNTIQARNNN